LNGYCFDAKRKSACQLKKNFYNQDQESKLYGDSDDALRVSKAGLLEAAA
jgi:hypothetical protein